MTVGPDDMFEWGDQHDAHIEVWVRHEVHRAFDEDLAALLIETADDLRQGLPVDWRAVLSSIDLAAEEADFGDRRGSYFIEIECPPIVEQVIDEAHDLCRAGMADEAARRLGLLIHPKWSSNAACQAEYDAVMAAQRAARLAPLRATLGDFANTALGAAALR